jgi:inhibitor of cysteine peptidase
MEKSILYVLKCRRKKTLMKGIKLYTPLARALLFMLTVSAIQIVYAIPACEKEPDMDEVTIDETCHGRLIEIFSNNRVILQLPENPSTGYRWELKPLDTNILKLQVDTYRAPTTMALGAKGIRIFEFLSQSTGTVNLRLHLRRPWESESANAEIFEVTLQILPPDAK